MDTRTAIIGGFATAVVGTLLGVSAAFAMGHGQDWLAAAAIAGLVANLLGLVIGTRKARRSGDAAER